MSEENNYIYNTAFGKMDELVQITVNCNGEDVMLSVDMETANILLNDPDEARMYVQRLINNTSGDIIWSSKKKPSERDNEATDLLLQLREKAANKFDDKKTPKMQLWQTIANSLNENGYFVGNGKDGAEKCRQKFTNMQKQYLLHIKHMKSTGERKKDPPPFFNEMHSILGSKDKSDPQHLQASIDYNTDEDTENIPGPSHKNRFQNEDTENIPGPSHKNRFQNVSKTVRPTSTNTQLIELMKKQHEEDREDRDRHFTSLHNILKNQNDQRDRMLNIFEKMVNKRKRKLSESESE